jgi:transcriptional regulator with XRE-family HTH domain
MLGMTRAQLAKASKVSARAIADFEADKRQPIHATLDAVQRALEAAGAEFVNGESPGVRVALKKKARRA